MFYNYFSIWKWCQCKLARSHPAKTPSLARFHHRHKYSKSWSFGLRLASLFGRLQGFQSFVKSLASFCKLRSEFSQSCGPLQSTNSIRMCPTSTRQVPLYKQNTHLPRKCQVPFVVPTSLPLKPAACLWYPSQSLLASGSTWKLWYMFIMCSKSKCELQQGTYSNWVPNMVERTLLFSAPLFIFAFAVLMAYTRYLKNY